MSKIITQWGNESTPFDDFTKDEISDYIYSLSIFLNKLKNVTKKNIISTYGTLLGAVRESSVISKDFDFDFAVIIDKHLDKHDLVSQFKDFLNEAIELNGVVAVYPASSSQCGIRCRFGKLEFTIDFFLAWFDDDYFIQAFSIDNRFKIHKTNIFPLTTVTLNGVSLPAPKDTDLLLTSIYGDQWHIPDPNFRYDVYFNKLASKWPTEFTVFGRVLQNKNYWEEYYLNADIKYTPTQFAVFTSDYLLNKSKILEIGAGSGRDTIYLAKQGHTITCTDFSESALNLIRHTAENQGLVNLEFINMDYANYIDLTAFSIEKINNYDVVYSRFLLHAVTEAAEQHIVEMISQVLKPDGYFFAEFRVVGDAYEKHEEWNDSEITGDHYRRPLEPHCIEKLLSRYGFTISYKVVGKGFAYHPSGDPLVCRIVAKKS